MSSSYFSLSEDSVIFSCGLLLPSNQESVAISISHDIEEHNPEQLQFSLNKVKHPPFVRLYETVLPSKNIDTAIASLEKITSTMIPFHMDWGMIEETQHFVSIWGELNEALAVFHQAVLIDVNSLREGFYKEKYIEDEQQHVFSEEEEESFLKWGSPWAEPYVPHMILAKAKTTFSTMPKKIAWDFHQCLFRGVHVGVRSDQGHFTHSYQILFPQKNQEKSEQGELTPSDILSLR